MRKILVGFLLFCFTLQGKPQGNDSIVKAIKKIYTEANKANQNGNLMVAQELYSQFIVLASTPEIEKPLWQEIRRSYSYLGSISEAILDYERAIFFLKKALEEVTFKYDAKDCINTFYFLNSIAKNYEGLFDFYKAFEYYQQAEALIYSTNSLSQSKKADLYHKLALCYLHLGMDGEGRTYINESICIRDSLRDFDDLASDYNLIALMFKSKKDFQEALNYSNRSLLLFDSLKYHDLSAFMVNNIGNIYLEKGSYDTCKLFYDKSLLMRLKMPDIKREDLIHSYNNVAYIHYKLNGLDSALYFNQLAMESNHSKTVEQGDTAYCILSAYLTSIADRIEINLKKFNTTKSSDFLSESYGLFQPTVSLLIGQMMKYSSLFPQIYSLMRIKGYLIH